MSVADLQRPASRGPPSRIKYIVLIYAVGASLWILLSDLLVQWLVNDPGQISLIGAIKGFLFVLVTALLLNSLLRRQSQTQPAYPPLPSNLLHRPAWSAALLIVAILAITVVAIVHNLQQQRDTEVARLQAISALKTSQISDWLQERQADAGLVQRMQHFNADQHDFAKGRAANELEQLQSLLHIGTSDENRGYIALQVVSQDGTPLWQSTLAPRKLAPPLREAVHLASIDRNIHRVGPYLGVRGTPRLDFVVPSREEKFTAIVVLHIDPKGWLYAALQDWPAPSRSGEILLFKRDADQVRFLNELRHRSGTAMRFSVPLAAPKLLASQVIRGQAKPGEIVQGNDYRNVPSLGVARAIAGTDWFLMAKMDQSEMYAEATHDAIWIGLAGLLALLMTLSGLYLIRQRQQLALASGVQQAQTDRLRALRLLAAIAESSNDAIFAKDVEGRYILFNPAASDIVGKPIDAVIGLDDTALFPPNEAQRLIATHRQVVAENRVITQEDRLHTAIGERVFLATKGPLRDASGKAIGTFGISRDITDRKVAEEALQDSTAMLQAMTHAALDAILMMDSEGRITFWNSAAEKIFGYAEHEVRGKELHHLIVPERYREAFYRGFQRFLETGTGAVFGKTLEVIGTRKGGHEFPVELSISPLTLKGRWNAVGILRDITERKQNEERARQQSQDLQSRNQELERFNQAMVGRELDMIALKRQVNDLSHRLGQTPPYPLEFLGEAATINPPSSTGKAQP